MNTLLFLALSSGGEAFFVGVMTCLLFMGVSFLYNYLKPKAKNAANNVLLQVNPNNIDGLIKKGYNEISNKSYIAAIDSFQKAINLSKENNDAIAGIAIAYHFNKDYINSKKHIEEFQNLSTTDSFDNSMTSIITYLYGHLCYMDGKIEQAQTCKDNAKIMASIFPSATQIINELNLY